jgi:hypothetical protein
MQKNVPWSKLENFTSRYVVVHVKSTYAFLSIYADVTFCEPKRGYMRYWKVHTTQMNDIRFKQPNSLDHKYKRMHTQLHRDVWQSIIMINQSQDPAIPQFCRSRNHVNVHTFGSHEHLAWHWLHGHIILTAVFSRSTDTCLVYKKFPFRFLIFLLFYNSMLGLLSFTFWSDFATEILKISLLPF